MLSLSVKHLKVLGVVFYIIQYLVKEEEITMWKTLSNYQNGREEGWETYIFQQRKSYELQKSYQRFEVPDGLVGYFSIP